MHLIEGQNYVYTAKSTTLMFGVVNCTLVGTKQKLFFIPQSSISGSGNTVTSTKYTIGDHDVPEGIRAILDNPEIDSREFERKIRGYFQDWNLEAEDHIIEIQKLKSFKIKTGFFSKGGYLKFHDKFLPQSFSLNGKGNAQKFADFYAGAI